MPESVNQHQNSIITIEYVKHDIQEVEFQGSSLTTQNSHSVGFEIINLELKHMFLSKNLYKGRYIYFINKNGTARRQFSLFEKLDVQTFFSN